MNELKNHYPFNLAFALLGESKYLSVYLPGIPEVLATLTEREAGVLAMRYQDKMTLEKIAQFYGVSRERIRQIEAKALRKLRHPARLRTIQGTSMTAMHELQLEHQKWQQKHHILVELYEHVKKSTAPLGAINLKDGANLSEATNILTKPIEDLNLSVRSYNCLRRAGITTVQELSQQSVDSIMQIRNLGRRSAEEIICVLNSHGIVLA